MRRHIWNKILIVVIMVLFCVPSLSPAQQLLEQKADVVTENIVEVFDELENEYTIEYTMTFSTDDLIFGSFMGYDTVEIVDGTIINDVGKPMMPAKEIKIALPEGIAAEDVHIVDTQSMAINGEYTIFPAQQPRRTNGLDDDLPFIEPDVETYNSMNPYPNTLVKFSHQTDLAGQGMAVIHLFPVQYIPLDKKLILYTSITFEIDGVDGYVCGDYLPVSISQGNQETYQHMIENMVINPDNVQLKAVENSPHPIGVGAGDYDYVIITSSSYVSYWQPLADWRTKIGLPANIVTTTWIYNSGGYGGDNQNKIRMFVEDAHINWGTQYFLIAGEHGTVPFEYRNYYENAPSDQYYSDYDDDYTHEVFVGRSTAEGSTQINRFINKVLDYEQDPPLSNYILDVLLIGMDVDSNTHLEYMKDDVDSIIPPRFDVTKVYDSHSGNHKTAATNAFNDGQHLVNHADHANTGVLGVGEWGIYSSDVDAFSNDGKPSIVVSLGCHPNEMDSDDCIAEHFVIYNSDQAGIAFNGNTRNGLYYEYNDYFPYYLSTKLDYWWWISLFNADKYILGETIVDSKHNFGTDPWNPDPGRHCVWEFCLLGDPAMPIWTDEPESFDVTHDSTLPSGTTSFDVHVEEIGGGDVYQAYVCLWKEDDGVYETGYTDANGDVTLTLTPTPTTIGTMYVTVTKHNYLPDEGDAEVVTVPEYTLTVNIEGSGEVDIDPAGPTYTSGTVVDLTPNADPGWEFDAWSGSDAGDLVDNGDGSWSITMNDDKEVTATFTPTGYILDLVDFPMYLAEAPDYDENCGSAVVQMNVDYMQWDNDPPVPCPTWCEDNSYTQSNLLSTYVSGTYFTSDEMKTALNDLKGDFYNFGIYQNTDGTDILGDICYWIDYEPPHDPGYPDHVPGAVPAYGDYSNWMAIRGIHTDEDPSIDGSFTVHGLWVNDPYPSGIGENTYKMASEWLSAYYDPLNVPGDPYHTKYVAVCEPPEDAVSDVDLVETTQYWDNIIPDPNSGSNFINQIFNHLIIYAATQGAQERVCPYDTHFAEIFEQSYPGKPISVKNLLVGDEKHDFFVVPYNSVPTGFTPRNGHSPDEEEITQVAVIVNAETGQFQEASWVDEPVKYLSISGSDAREIVYNALVDMGINPDDLPTRALHTDLVYRGGYSQFSPEWRVTINELGLEFYISQDGTISI